MALLTHTHTNALQRTFLYATLNLYLKKLVNTENCKFNHAFELMQETLIRKLLLINIEAKDRALNCHTTNPPMY